MKQSLKISSLIIFAATIASAFTSCGNDSELFDEPVVYQTRAMTRASMGGEGPRQQFITNGGISIATKSIVDGEACVEVSFSWSPGYVSYTYCRPTVSFRDLDYGDRYEYTFKEIKDYPIVMSGGGNAGIRQNAKGEQVWHIDITGKKMVYRYDTYTRETTSFVFDVADSYYSDIALIIIEKPVSSIYSNNPTIHTPTNFGINDSLTIQKQ